MINVEKIKSDFAKRNVIRSEHMLYNEGFDPSKLYIKNAFGDTVYGIDGTSYIDLVLGSGSVLLGHRSHVIDESIMAATATGTIFSQPHVIAETLAKELLECLPSHLAGVVFCNSGTEATMRAMRLARAYTKKKKIAIFSGGWHGTHDYALFGEDYKQEPSPYATELSSGIPACIKDTIIMLPYNNIEAFNIIEKNKDDIAMVFIEPVQGSNPRNDIYSFLKFLRLITKDNNILLGFDEMITGFRLGLGGAQEYFDINADLVTYGKIIGGGFPFGVLCGTDEVMKTIKSQGVFMGGTFSANPFVCSVSLSLLRHLKRSNIYTPLNKQSARLKDEINHFCLMSEIPVRMWGLKSFMRLIFTNQYILSRKDRDKFECSQEIQKLFYMELCNRGILVASNRIIFLSSEHKEQTVDTIIKTICGLLREFDDEGFFNIKEDSVKLNDKAL